MTRSAFILLSLTFTLTALSCSKPRAVTFLDHQNAGDEAFIKGDYANAEKHYKEALALAQNDGSKNRLIPIALSSLGTNYNAWGKYPEAEDAYKRELEMLERMSGPESSDLLTPLGDLTWLYLKQKNFVEAEIYNRRATAIVEKLPSNEHQESREVIRVQRELLERQE